MRSRMLSPSAHCPLKQPRGTELRRPAGAAAPFPALSSQCRAPARKPRGRVSGLNTHHSPAVLCGTERRGHAVVIRTQSRIERLHRRERHVYRLRPQRPQQPRPVIERIVCRGLRECEIYLPCKGLHAGCLHAKNGLFDMLSLCSRWRRRSLPRHRSQAKLPAGNRPYGAGGTCRPCRTHTRPRRRRCGWARRPNAGRA